MRRTDREVREVQELLQIVEMCSVCRVALMDSEAPYIVPMNFGYEIEDGDGSAGGQLTLWFHCALEGHKLDLIGSGCAAGFEMDCGHALLPDAGGAGGAACLWSMAYASIVGRGFIHPVADTDERLRGLRLLMAHYGGEGLPFSDAVLAQTCVLRLDTSEFSGKRLARR